MSVSEMWVYDTCLNQGYSNIDLNNHQVNWKFDHR